MGRANRKMGGAATLRRAESMHEETLSDLHYENLQLTLKGVEKTVHGGDPFLLHVDQVERQDWGDSTALTYQSGGQLGAVFFSRGEPRYASAPGSRYIRSLDGGPDLGTLPPMPSLTEISKTASEQAEEELAARGGDPRKRMVLEGKYTGRALSEAFHNQKAEILRVLKRAL